MTFFAKHKGTRRVAGRAGWRSGQRGLFTGQAKRFRDQWQLDQPHSMVLFGGDGDERRASAGQPRGPAPDLPADQGRRLLGPPARHHLRPRPCVDDVPDAAARRGAARARPARRAHRARLDPRARRLRAGRPRPRSASASRRRWSPSWCWPGAGARPRPRRPGRAPAATAACSAAFDAAAAVRADRRASARSARRSSATSARPHPMNRLLQGEVGSGKTLVALRAMLRVVDSGGQAALLAPTEVLAQQHHRSITAHARRPRRAAACSAAPPRAPRSRCSPAR